MFDYVVIGSGFAGSVLAREMAENGKNILILEEREHIGGNCYDRKEEHGILIHQYGPHIFHTKSQEVYEYLSRFTDWYEYRHEVVGNIYGKEIPIPFNLNSLKIVYGEKKGEELEGKLLGIYGKEARIPIMELRENGDPEIRDIAEYVYQNIFLKYTMKQWGQKPEEVDSSVTARVPVLLSEDNRYFQDTYQGMPKNGFTALFEKMLHHPGIEICTGVRAQDRMKFLDGRIELDGELFEGKVIYTGMLDELFSWEYGRLPYRSLRFGMEYHRQEFYQSHGVVNYTVSEDYTRITEFKYLTGQESEGTVIMKEYPRPYLGKEGEMPYYAVLNEENQRLYERYAGKAALYKNLYLLGRLAEYKYYNIDGIVLKALELSNRLKE